MEDIAKIKTELDKTRLELSILYEVSNAMRTTLNLDEILYIILTAVTSHVGLAFNRAMLFLVNDTFTMIEGRMGIGPETGEEAGRVWGQIEKEKMDLDDLIAGYRISHHLENSQFNRFVKSLSLPLNEEQGGILALTILDGMPLHINQETIGNYQNIPLIRSLNTTEFITVPLKAKDRVIGVILADNIFSKKPITRDDLRVLTMFANQAGLAIENSKLYEKTVIKTHTDSLTNLWNHGYFQHILQEEIERSRDENASLSLIMLDIDNFKNYNDTLGHQAGDETLKDIAKIIKDTCRKIDYPCRYGGEEFSIILPKTAKQEANLIAQRLRQAVEEYPFKQEEIQPNKQLTVSIGVASFPEDGNEKPDLISSADKALYIAKDGGRNKVSVYNW